MEAILSPRSLCIKIEVSEGLQIDKIGKVQNILGLELPGLSLLKHFGFVNASTRDENPRKWRTAKQRQIDLAWETNAPLGRSVGRIIEKRRRRQHSGGDDMWP